MTDTKTCPHCGSKVYADHWLVVFHCGTQIQNTGIVTRSLECTGREPLFRALQEARAEIKALKNVHAGLTPKAKCEIAVTTRHDSIKVLSAAEKLYRTWATNNRDLHSVFVVRTSAMLAELGPCWTVDGIEAALRDNETAKCTWIDEGNQVYRHVVIYYRPLFAPETPTDPDLKGADQ